MKYNKFRSKAFIKIKHCIQKSDNNNHLVSCKQMIENATPILSKDELIILKQYFEEKEHEMNNPYIWENPIETEIHKRQCESH